MYWSHSDIKPKVLHLHTCHGPKREKKEKIGPRGRTVRIPTQGPMSFVLTPVCPSRKLETANPGYLVVHVFRFTRVKSIPVTSRSDVVHLPRGTKRKPLLKWYHHKEESVDDTGKLLRSVLDDVGGEVGPVTRV